MKITVRVPATIANLGPGFDCFGLALPIYNEITVEEEVLPNSGININVIEGKEKVDTLFIPTDETNIVYKAINLLYNFIGQTATDLKITIKTSIPISKGLGSSASVIVGGLIAANELLGKPADEVALLSIATAVEGHPDNIASAILGNFVLSSLEDDGSVIYRKLKWPTEWKITVLIPDYELNTDISRSVLPEKISLKDAVFNSRRCAMFIEAVNKKDKNLMKKALQDKIHQPYRAKLVKGLNELTENLKNEENIFGCVLSGAGPSIAVISEEDAVPLIKEKINEVCLNQNIIGSVRTMSVEENGAIII